VMMRGRFNPPHTSTGDRRHFDEEHGTGEERVNSTVKLIS